MMKVVCLDFEGVLVPDFWPNVAKSSGIQELKLTTRDVKNYRELMERRVNICHKHGITLQYIQSCIAQLGPLPGAEAFVQWLRERCQLILLSDTFYQFVPHFMRIFGYPTLFCHNIGYNRETGFLEFHLRMEDQKAHSVRNLKALNFEVFAAGDSYNDITMLREADEAAFIGAPDGVLKDFPQYPNLKDLKALQQRIEAFLAAPPTL